MVDQQFVTARRIAEEAMEFPPRERMDHLEAACGDDQDLHAAARRLIADAQDSDGYLEGMDLDLTPGGASPDPSPIPDRIGPFEITRIIATGGWSIVYEGRQSNPDRQVAVKVLHASLASTSAQQRFTYESEVLARLKHPGLVEIYQAGTFDSVHGRSPWFAMELIEQASSIDTWAARSHLDIDQRLALFADLCDIVHYGHTRGVVHCDLKPGNIIVDRDGRLRVIDFGIAMAVGDDGLQPADITETGRIVGTIQYMAPEQFAGDLERIDTRTDVRGLGVVLYQLLTGQKPWDLSGLASHEAIHVVQETSPPLAGRLDPRLDGDLETIIATAMRSNPEDRYGSVLELRQDIDRYRASLPIQARTPGPLRIANLFIRRHRIGVAVTTCVALTLCTSLVISIVAWQRATRATAEAVREAGRATTATGFLAEMFSLAHPGVAAGGVIGVEHMLDEATAYTNTAFREDPEGAARIRLALARIQLGVGDLDGAQANLDAYPPVTEPDSPMAIEADVLRGRLEHVRGDLDQAEARLGAILDRHPDSHDPAVIEALGRMAGVMIERIDYERAASLLAVAIERATGTLGSTDARTIELQAQLGRTNAALIILESPQAPPIDAPLPYTSVEAVIDALGPTHPATFLARLAALDHSFVVEGFTPSFVDRLRGIHRQARAALGPMHPRTLETSIELAATLQAFDELVEAESLLRDAITAYDLTLGPGHSHAALGRLYLGRILIDRGANAEAGEVLGRSWQANHALWGDGDPRTIDAEANLAIALLRQQRLDDALGHYRAAVVAMVDSPMLGRGELYWSLRRALIETAVAAGRVNLARAEAAALRADVARYLSGNPTLAAELLDVVAHAQRDSQGAPP